MSLHVLEPTITEAERIAEGRQRASADDALVLTEMPAHNVVDHLDIDGGPIELITFGTVRETCPKCQHTHLKLVLRQRRVRAAHLLCGECASCFDAHYQNGASALTI